MRELGRQHQMKHWCFCRVEAVRSPRDNIAILPDQEFSFEVLQVNNLPINKSRTEGLVFDMAGRSEQTYQEDAEMAGESERCSPSGHQGSVLVSECPFNQQPSFQY